jgi:Protein of unknown function (DUF2892)
MKEQAPMSIVNEGTLDRVIRVAVGVAVLSLVFVGPKSPWAWLGLVPLLTGLIGYCPLYAVLGIRTCPLRQ